MALSDSWLKANHGKERPRLAERGDRDGLGVRITPKGKITFQLRFRSGGKFSRLGLGTGCPVRGRSTTITTTFRNRRRL